MKAGETFGEMSVIDGGGSATATLTAVDDSEVLELPKVDLEKCLTGNSDLSAKFWRAIARELRDRLSRTSDGLRNYVDINRALIDNPNFREFYSLCHR